jgi:hypothetical protein
MPVTPHDMIRLGLGKLLEYFDMSKDELHTFMVEEGLETIEKLSIYLSEDTEVCNYCGDNYAHLEDTGMCYDCRQYIVSHKNWR